MAVTEAQVRAAFQVVSQASSVTQANELLGSELAPLFNQGASGEGFSEFEAPVGDPLQISLAFPKVSFETSVSGVAAGTYGSSTQVPVVTVDKYGRVLDVTLADIGEAGPTGPASGDLSGEYPSPTVSGLSGHALPALGATSGGLRWTGASWVLDATSYALSVHAHDYLPTSNPAFTGILYQDGIQRIASDGTGWFQYLNSSALVGSTIRPLVVRADGLFVDQDAATFRGTISAAAAVHDHTSITGSAAKLTTPRSIGMTGDGTWSVSFDGSANASGAMTLASIITAGGPVGSATKAPQFTWDSKGRLTAVDEVAITPAWSSITSKPTTFSGLGVTMLASDIPNHASRHHWDGADPLDGQSIAGLRTTSSPTFYNLNISEGIYFSSNSNSISTSLSDTIFRTDGTVRFRISPSEIRATVQFRAPFGGFDNLSGGGNVRADSSGRLVVGGLLESELPFHTHSYLPIVDPAFTGSLSGPSASFSGLVSASSFHASSNGVGENFRVGDDLWIGDVNLSHTALLKGYSDPTRAFLKFGTSGPVFGSNGSVFSISHLTGSTSRLVTVSSGGELGATSWANDGPWLPLSGAARVSGWVAFDSAVYPTSTIRFSGYTLHQLSIEAHTAFSFTGASVSFLSAVSFGSSVQASNSFSFLPVFQTARLGSYGSNKAAIPSTSTTVYLEEGTGYQYRNYSAPILPDGQIQIYYGMNYGPPIIPPQLFAAADHVIYNALGEILASPSSAVSVFGVMIVQARDGDLFVLNRGDLT